MQAMPEISSLQRFTTDSDFHDPAGYVLRLH